jgi:hypothetical protein
MISLLRIFFLIVAHIYLRVQLIISFAERLKRLNALKAEGLLTDEEYAAQGAKIISEL